MTQFIMWPKSINVKFRASYLAKTGEKIQDTPLESEDDLSYMVGSSRVSEKQLDELKNDIAITTEPGAIKTRKSVYPDEWAGKIENLEL